RDIKVNIADEKESSNAYLDRKEEDRKDVYDHREYNKWTSTVFGEKDSIPSDRTLHIKTNDAVSFIVYSDTHFSSHDENACNAFIRCVKYLPHDFIVHGGDCLDCYGLSKYGKDPRKIFTASLKQEVNDWKVFSN